MFKFITSSITSSCKNTKSSTNISPNRKTDWTTVKSRPGGRPLKEGGKRSDAAEHITVRAHRVVPHEQVASEDFVVEVVGELAHRPFEVVSLRDDVPGEVFLAVPLAAVGFLEVVEFVVELHIIIDGLLANAIGGMS